MTLEDIFARHDALDRRSAQSEGMAASDQPPSLLAILWRRKLTVLGTLLLFLAVGIAYIVITPPRYLAATSLLIDPRLGKMVGSDPVQPGYIPDTSAMDSQIKLFTSQTVLSRAAKLADLKDVPAFNGSQRSFLQDLLHTVPNLVEGVDLVALDKAITIKRPERTYVVDIEVLAHSPTLAADIANDLAKAYIEDQVTSRIDSAQDDSTFVKDQLSHLSTQIEQAQERVEAYKVAHNIVDSNGLRSNEQQVADLTKSLGEARARESDAKAYLAEINLMAKNGHLDATSAALKSPTIELLRQEQAQTDQTVARLATTLGPDHPALIEARARQREMRNLIHNELTRLKLSALQDYQVARQHESQIVSGVTDLKAQSAGLSRNLVPLEALERNVRVLRSSFERFAQVNVSLSQQEADSPPGRVIAVARPPVSPARPRKTLIGVISFAGGLFFGLAAALFAESVSGPQAPQRDRPSERGPTARDCRRPAQDLAPRRPRSVARRYWDDDDAHA